jgi:hypothetical protein
MTDMAPFVAVVLKDRVMSDLISELNLLRAWKHDSEDVKITGPATVNLFMPVVI